MRGILVHGDNHFIVEGPLPDRAAARRLARTWEMPMLGVAPEASPHWRIVTRALREQLEWAVVLEHAADEPHSAAVTQLLAELAARGVTIHRAGEWPGAAWPLLDC